MNPPSITRSVSKAFTYPPPINLFRSMISSQIVQIPAKKPAPFASALAHEVRNPLTNINLAVEMLKSSIREEDQQIYLDIIMRSSLRITVLINELLKSQQSDELHSEKHSIHQLLDEVSDMAKDRIKLKSISVSKDYAIEDCKIVLNRPQMMIALTNIIINAIDAMESEKGELKLVTKSIAGKHVIEIADNGCGISKKDLKYIFTPYYSNKPGGLGLGLATTFEILRLNHIGINVKSEVGEGTRFILLFDKKQPYNSFNG